MPRNRSINSTAWTRARETKTLRGETFVAFVTIHHDFVCLALYIELNPALQDDFLDNVIASATVQHSVISRHQFFLEC